MPVLEIFMLFILYVSQTDFVLESVDLSDELE